MKCQKYFQMFITTLALLSAVDQAMAMKRLLAGTEGERLAKINTDTFSEHISVIEEQLKAPTPRDTLMENINVLKTSMDCH